MTNYAEFSELVKEIYPVVGMIAYGNGNYEVIRKAKVKSEQPTAPRGNIKMCSKKSLKRLMFLMQVTEARFSSMFTATYPKVYPKDGEIVHSDINALANKFRREGFRYIWFLEFQKRGAPHIHWLLEAGGISPRMRANFGLYWSNRMAQAKWFERPTWGDKDYADELVKIVKFNLHPKVWELLREPDSAKRYVMKYAAKEMQKTVPKRFSNVGRFWGSTQDLKPEGIEFDATEEDVQEWLARREHPMSEKGLVPKYLWQVGTLTKAQPVLSDS